jgi:CDP-diacylglycerol--glycerol-3-phosphate 3-phosphatidyltransferase
MLDNAKSRSIAAHVLDPVAKALLAMRLSASAVTVLGAIGSIAVAVTCIAHGRFLLAAILMLPLAGADAIDGTMARIARTQGPWGSFLDSTTDRFTDGAIFAAISWWCMSQGDTGTAIAALVGLIAGFATSYIRAKAESLGVECKVGIAERPERVGGVMLGVFLAGIGLDVMLPVLVYVVGVLSCITVGQRMAVVRRALQHA